MRKNIDKWNHYKGILEEKAQEFIADYSDDIPDVFYEVLNSGKIQIYLVEKVGYRFSEHGVSVWFSGKIPSKTEIEKLKEAVEKGVDHKYENISLHYRYKMSIGSASGAYLLNEVIESDRFFKSRVSATEEAVRVTAEREREEYLLNNGHIRCHFCNNVVAEEVAVEETMISRMYDNSRKRFSFCSGKCASHCQMSLEG